METLDQKIVRLLREERRRWLLRKARENLERLWIVFFDRQDHRKTELLGSVLWPDIEGPELSPT